MNLDSLLRSLEPEWPPTPELAPAVTARTRTAPRRRGLRPALAVALVALLLAGGAVAAVTPVRELFFGGRVEVQRVPQLPPAPRERALGVGPALGLAEARRRAGFRAPWPRAFERPTFHGARGRFAAVSGRLLFVAMRGDVPRELARKIVTPATTVLEVGETLWIEGSPHIFLFRDPSGEIREEQVRLAGNVYLFTREGLLLRIEGARSRREAVRLAASVR